MASFQESTRDNDCRTTCDDLLFGILMIIGFLVYITVLVTISLHWLLVLREINYTVIKSHTVQRFSNGRWWSRTLWKRAMVFLHSQSFAEFPYLDRPSLFIHFLNCGFPDLLLKSNHSPRQFVCDLKQNLFLSRVHHFSMFLQNISNLILTFLGFGSL